MCCDIIAMHWQKHIFQIYDKGGYGEVVEAGAGGGALLTPRPLQHTSSVSKVKPGLQSCEMSILLHRAKSLN